MSVFRIVGVLIVDILSFYVLAVAACGQSIGGTISVSHNVHATLSKPTTQFVAQPLDDT